MRLEMVLPLTAARLAEVTVGDPPIVARTISNLTIARHNAWIDRQRRLSDIELGQLDAVDFATSTVFSEDAPFR